jgi:hypothetical protein
MCAAQEVMCVCARREECAIAPPMEKLPSICLFLCRKNLIHRREHVMQGSAGIIGVHKYINLMHEAVYSDASMHIVCVCVCVSSFLVERLTAQTDTRPLLIAPMTGEIKICKTVQC